MKKIIIFAFIKPKKQNLFCPARKSACGCPKPELVPSATKIVSVP